MHKKFSKDWACSRDMLVDRDAHTQTGIFTLLGSPTGGKVTINFHLRNAVLAQVLAMALCLSVCHKSEIYQNGKMN